MRKTLYIIAGLIVLAFYQFSFAGIDLGGNGSTENSNGTVSDPYDNFDINPDWDIYQVFESIMEQIMAATQADFGSDPGSGLKLIDTAACLDVEIGLPDTVILSGAPDLQMASGYFFLYNCYTETEEIQLDFDFTVTAGNDFDTTLNFSTLYITLEPGDSVHCIFQFPVPPITAVYILCVTATSNEISYSDCVTMAVIDNENPGIPFSAPGFLYQGPDCVLFMELGDSNAALILENYGLYGPGDTVLVNGTLVQDCEIECSGAQACVLDNTIEALNNPLPPIEICGYLIEAGECILFMPAVYSEYSDSAFLLDNYGDFQVNDMVLVSGTLDFGCQTECVGAIGCILDNTIEYCSVPPYFEGCGVLIEDLNCLLFQPEDNIEAAYSLAAYGGFGPGDSVYVEGDIYYQTDTLCPYSDGLILNTYIAECYPDTIPGIFTGCGIILEAPDCTVFMPFDLYNVFYILSDFGGYVHGDTVYVEGQIAIMPDSLGCSEPVDFLVVDTIMPCSPTPQYYAGCGLLVEANNCLLFTSADFGDFAAAMFSLTNYADFQVGDSVFITGSVYFQPDSLCPGSMGYIVNEVIESCLDSLPENFAGCGYLYEDQGCLIFYPFNHSFGYLLDNYGDFSSSDSVFVSGQIYDCGTPCNNVVACIENTVIQGCGNPNPYFSGCGLIIEAPDCTVFMPFTWFNAFFTLSDYGGYGDGDSVYVTGMISALQDTTSCSGPVGYIEVDSIFNCNAAPSNQFSASGYLQEYGDCLVFYEAYIYGPPYRLENYGDFVAGDTVFVSGYVEAECDLYCSENSFCLLNNTIEATTLEDSIMPTNAMRWISEVRSYPNPFNPIANISFNISEPSRVYLEIYNILGQKVETLIAGEYLAGHQTRAWNGEEYSSGIYFYRIRTDNDVVTKKMILSK